MLCLASNKNRSPTSEFESPFGTARPLKWVLLTGLRRQPDHEASSISLHGRYMKGCMQFFICVTNLALSAAKQQHAQALEHTAT
jgi:hypothetical protein